MRRAGQGLGEIQQGGEQNAVRQYSSGRLT